MISVTENFATDFQEFKASTAERIDKIERVIRENVMEHDTVQTEDMKQQAELLQNENNRLRMESESLLKVIELLSVQQINTREINDNTENFITVKETGKNKKNKLNHQQDYRIPQKNSFELFPSKNARTNRNLLMRTTQCYLHLIMVLVKKREKKQSTKDKTNRGLHY